MSKYDKLITKLLNRKSVISYKEIKYILIRLGYTKSFKGKTSGSRIAYFNQESKHIIRLHKPHPKKDLKDYVKKAIVAELTNRKLI